MTQGVGGDAVGDWSITTGGLLVGGRGHYAANLQRISGSMSKKLHKWGCFIRIRNELVHKLILNEWGADKI